MNIRFGVAALGLALVCAGPLQAEDKALSVETTVDVNSAYMFRGFNLYDGLSVQPSVVATYATDYGTIGGSLWMHLSGDGDRNAEKFTELDESIWYGNNIGPVSFEVGAVWYTYPNDDDNIDNTGEFFANFSYDDSSWNPIALNPTFSIYHDWDQFDAQYYELGISHELSISALGDGFAITPYAAFGFSGNGDKVYQEDGLVQITYGASMALKLGDVSVTPSLNYTHGVADGLDNQLWAGASFGYGF